MTFLTVIFAVAILVAVVIAIPIFGGFGKRSNTNSKSYRKNAVSLNRAETKAKWAEIMSVANVGGAAQLKSAILDADKLVEKVLFSSGYQGKTFAECLKAARTKFTSYSDYDNLWFAHKVRNSIAHDNGMDFNATNAKKALGYFEKALKILGAL